MEEVVPHLLIILMWISGNPVPTAGIQHEILMSRTQCEIRANESQDKLKAQRPRADIEIRTFCIYYPVDVELERFQRPTP
jgi:hypothetical protein